MHQESAPSSFLGETIPTRDLRWFLQVLLTFFQSKMSELMETLEYVRAYLDDLLCISRSSLEDHLNKLEEVLGLLLQCRLKSQHWKINILRT
jgi:hypothetical protein